MKIKTFPHKTIASEAVTEAIIDHLEQKESLVLGVATGKTMEPFYEVLVEKLKDRTDLAKLRLILLDDFWDLPPQDLRSFKTIIENFLMKPLNLTPSQFFFPDVKQADEKLMLQTYKNEIHECGGIDIQLLGIGKNGHIGFNEPGSTEKSVLRKLALSAETRQQHQVDFSEIDNPKWGVTLGISEILAARKIYLLAWGQGKAAIIKRLYTEEVSENCPATFIKHHSDAEVILDQEAAALISLKI